MAEPLAFVMVRRFVGVKELTTSLRATFRFFHFATMAGFVPARCFAFWFKVNVLLLSGSLWSFLRLTAWFALWRWLGLIIARISNAVNFM